MCSVERYMSSAPIIEQTLESLRADYLSAFKEFARAVDTLSALRECEEANFHEIQRAESRVRDAQTACREARDRLADMLLERRHAKLSDRSRPGLNRLFL